MIGTKFEAGIEMKITTDKDFYQQGDEITGEFYIKNHGTNQISFDQLNVALSYGVIKKIHAKADDAFKSMDKIVIAENISLNASEEKSFSWKMELAENYPITDKQKSLYLIYGASSNPFECGQLQLSVEIEALQKFFLEMFVNFHRFQIKQTKFNKDMVEVKLVPPKSREMTVVKQLVLRMLKNDRDLKVDYVFTLEKLESVSTTEAKVQKSKKTYEQILTPKDYEEFGSFGHDKVKAKIAEILKEVIPKLYF